MKLFRVRAISDWAFLIATDEIDAQKMFCEGFGFELDEVTDIIEYPLNFPRILPSGWQSEPKPVEIPLATLDVMEHNGRHPE